MEISACSMYFYQIRGVVPPRFIGPAESNGIVCRSICRDVIKISMWLVQYRPQALQHLHTRKLRAMWWIFMQNPHQKLVCKLLHKLLHATFLHSNLCVFLRRLILLVKIHVSCVYFFTTANMADVIFRKRQCGKKSFRGEKENNLVCSLQMSYTA